MSLTAAVIVKFLEFHAWPPYPAEGLFFDDDGHSTAYQHGGFSRTRLRAEQKNHKFVMRISAAQGHFPEQVKERRVSLVLHRAGEVESARVNGENATATSEADFVRISFTGQTRKDTDVEIIFRYE